MCPATGSKKIVTVGIAKAKKARQSQHRIEEDDLEEWKKSKQLLKPKDQVELLDIELKEISGRVLSVQNIQIPDNIVVFSFLQGQFVPIVQQTQFVVAFEQKGSYIHKDSEEGRNQLIEQGIDPATLDVVSEEEVEILPEAVAAATGEGEDGEAGEGEEGADGAAEGEDGAAANAEKAAAAESEKAEGEADEAAPSAHGKKLTNQFNFCERAALTYNLPFRTQETQTVPPPMRTFSANVLQWIIYDAYLEDYEAQMLEKERERERKERDKAPVAKHAGGAAKKRGGRQLSEAVQGRVFEAWKVLERMINQNSYDEIAKDFRYWEDPSDEYREDEGTLLPLWKYTYEKTKKHTVTDITWNPWYYDLFAVCFGYLDFLKPTPDGAVCLFTIKNPSYPEHICMTESPVMCVDIHPKYPYMVVVGLYDGNVNVFNVQATCKKPAFVSHSSMCKHAGIVWEIKWVPDLPDGEMNFYSIAIDGKVINWVLMQNELNVTIIINLYLEVDPVPGPDGTLYRMQGCASCIIFHPKEPLIYMVGTEEGNIYKCSTNYSSKYLLTYRAHHMPVYKIDYNKYNSDIFITCSGDWRVKIWEDNRLEPLFAFDLGASVGDVKWAPYSSTIFAAVTVEGKVCVFDLNVNKYKPICIQAVVSKRRNKLTKICFNYNLPIIIVGDDKGTITSLKLSPNLRIPCKAPKKQQHLDQWTLQCMKLDRLLALVREPLTLSVNTETTHTEVST